MSEKSRPLILRVNPSAEKDQTLQSSRSAVGEYLGQEGFSARDAEVAAIGLVRAISEHFTETAPNNPLRLSEDLEFWTQRIAKGL